MENSIKNQSKKEQNNKKPQDNKLMNEKQNNQTVTEKQNKESKEKTQTLNNKQNKESTKTTQNNFTNNTENTSKNGTTDDHSGTLLNTIHHICSLSMNSIEDVITLAKNTTFQNAITDIHSRYEVISKECHLLSKAMNICLTPVDCITKFKNWATVRIDALFDCSTQNLAKILYGGTACEIAELIVKQSNCEGANADILNLAEKLENLQEHHIHDLKKYLSIKE